MLAAPPTAIAARLFPSGWLTPASSNSVESRNKVRKTIEAENDEDRAKQDAREGDDGLYRCASLCAGKAGKV